MPTRDEIIQRALAAQNAIVDRQNAYRGENRRQERAAVSTVPDIKAAVARFGAKVRAAHPDASFYVSVRLAKGHRKPNGYDAAARRNGFGQDDFMRVEDRRTQPAKVDAPVSSLTPTAGAAS